MVFYYLYKKDDLIARKKYNLAPLMETPGRWANEIIPLDDHKKHKAKGGLIYL